MSCKKNQTDGICVTVKTSPADMSAVPTNVIQPTALFHDSKHIFV